MGLDANATRPGHPRELRRVRRDRAGVRTSPSLSPDSANSLAAGATADCSRCLGPEAKSGWSRTLNTAASRSGFERRNRRFRAGRSQAFPARVIRKRCSCRSWSQVTRLAYDRFSAAVRGTIEISAPETGSFAGHSPQRRDSQKCSRAENVYGKKATDPSIEATKDAVLQALQETGATGLEPATSGVTGRHGATGYSRLRPGITG
jgi:hypothetical protein